MATDRDVLAASASDRRWTYALLAGGAAAVLGVLPLLADLLGRFSFIPFGDAVRWIADLDAWWGWIARPAAGLLVGGFAAAVVLENEWRLEVGDDDVIVVHGKDRRRLDRDSIVGIHLDRRKVVIDGRGRRLFEETVEAERTRVLEAFGSRGYPLETD